MNNLNLPEEKKNALLQTAAQKLGTDPTTLQKQLESGQLDNLIKNMDPKAAGQLSGLLSNPKAIEALLQSEKVRNMLGNLGK